jgi:aldose 1-epimerase
MQSQRTVELILNLEDERFQQAKLILFNYGATIAALELIEKDNNVLDVVLGTDSIDEYIEKVAPKINPYFGICGRTCNR